MTGALVVLINQPLLVVTLACLNEMVLRGALNGLQVIRLHIDLILLEETGAVAGRWRVLVTAGHISICCLVGGKGGKVKEGNTSGLIADTTDGVVSNFVLIVGVCTYGGLVGTSGLGVGTSG